MLHRLAAVDRKDGSGDVAASPAAQIQRCAGDVTRNPDPADRNMTRDTVRLFLGTGGECGHSALEGSRCECVDRDVPPCELAGERAGEVVNGSLRRAVGIGVVGQRLRAHDGAKIDHARRVRVRSGLFEQRQKLAGEMKDRRYVDIHDLGPGMIGEGLKRLAPGSAGIVDENVQRVGAAFHLPDQCADTGFGADIAGEPFRFAGGTERVEFGRYAFAVGALARGDHHVGAAMDQCRRRHASNAARSACDQGFLACHRKKIVEIGHGFHSPTDGSKTVALTT